MFLGKVFLNIDVIEHFLVERSIKQYSAGPLASLSKKIKQIRLISQIVCHAVSKADDAKCEGTDSLLVTANTNESKMHVISV